VKNNFVLIYELLDGAFISPLLNYLLEEVAGMSRVVGCFGNSWIGVRTRNTETLPYEQKSWILGIPRIPKLIH
jgi:hypothetical protein